MSTSSSRLDLLVVGGGINGAGIARDAAGRGLSVALAERGDLASATSSASSKLVHGGLRYLERLELRLVREALAEREVLMGIAPHLVTPMRFVVPHARGLRPRWMLRLGLFLYDHLARRATLPGSESLRLDGHPYGEALAPAYRHAFAYSDCRVDDARLVVANARGAADLGARVWTRTCFEGAEAIPGGWRARLSDARTGRSDKVETRSIVNAAGPWVSSVLDRVPAARRRKRVRLVKGSHLVMPRLYGGHHAYLLQNDDARVIFLIPYEGEFTLVGTTDVPIEGDPGDARVADEEVDYLCRAASRYLRSPLHPRDVVSAWTGVRPLVDDGASDASKVTRDYSLDLERRGDGATLLSVYGGKITTYRRLAEQALELLGAARPPWTAGAPLPGGDIPDLDPQALAARLAGERPRLPAPLLRALVDRHGSRAQRLLGDADEPEALGERFAEDLYELEVRYLVEQEWALEPDDVLRRRTRAWHRASPKERERLSRHLARMHRRADDSPIAPAARVDDA